MRTVMILATVLLAGPVLAQSATPVRVGPAATRPTPPPLPGKTTLKPIDADVRGDGSQPRQRFITVFGVDKCPPPTSPDEIVVCTRLPESQQYRIPTQLRGKSDVRVSAYEYNRNLLLGEGAGGAGGSIGSCTANGPGGFIGCNRKQADAWAQDRANRMGTTEVVPPQ